MIYILDEQEFKGDNLEKHYTKHVKLPSDYERQLDPMTIEQYNMLAKELSEAKAIRASSEDIIDRGKGVVGYVSKGGYAKCDLESGLFVGYNKDQVLTMFRLTIPMLKEKMDNPKSDGYYIKDMSPNEARGKQFIGYENFLKENGIDKRKEFKADPFNITGLFITLDQEKFNSLYRCYKTGVRDTYQYKNQCEKPEKVIFENSLEANMKNKDILESIYPIIGKELDYKVEGEYIDENVHALKLIVSNISDDLKPIEKFLSPWIIPIEYNEGYVDRDLSKEQFTPASRKNKISAVKIGCKIKSKGDKIFYSRQIVIETLRRLNNLFKKVLSEKKIKIN